MYSGEHVRHTHPREAGGAGEPVYADRGRYSTQVQGSHKKTPDAKK